MGLIGATNTSINKAFISLNQQCSVRICSTYTPGFQEQHHEDFFSHTIATKVNI
jgi:hypothetical protein